MGRNPTTRATTSASRDNQADVTSQSDSAIDTASLKLALLDCERTLDTKTTAASPAYQANGWTGDFVLLPKSAPAAAPAYSEKPSSLADNAVPIKDVKAAPKELFKEKEVPFAAESFVVAQLTGVDFSTLSDCDPAPEFEWAATKLADMEFEEHLMGLLLEDIARMDAAAAAKTAAEAADKVVEFDGVSYVKAW